MPKMVKKYKHGLTKDEAVKRIRAAVEKEKITKAGSLSSAKENWVTDNNCIFSFSIFGHNVDGELLVEDDTASITLNLPFVAVMVKGMVESQLDSEMEKLFS